MSAPPGAKSASFKAGPLVEAPPGGLGSAAAVNSLDNAMTSGDPTVILGALGAVSSIEIVTLNRYGGVEREQGGKLAVQRKEKERRRRVLQLHDAGFIEYAG